MGKIKKERQPRAKSRGRRQETPESPPKTKKNIFSSIGLAINMCWRNNKITVLMCFVSIIMRVALPYVGILLPKVVIDQITAAVEIKTFLINVGGTALLLVALNYIKSASDSIVDVGVGIIGIDVIFNRRLNKNMDIDYELLEDAGFKVASDKADKAIQSNHAPAMNIPKTLVELLSNFFGFALYASVIMLIHPLILLLLVIGALANWFMLRRVRVYSEKTREERSKTSRKFNALNTTLRRPENAKDIRMYNAFDWLYGLACRQYGEYMQSERKVLTKTLHARLVNAVMILIRDGAAYAFLIYLLLENQITLGDFVFVFAAIGALATWVTGTLNAGNDLSRACIEFSDIEEYFHYPDRMNRGKGVALPSGAEIPPSLELVGVTYKYPKAEKPTLQNINLLIKPGERVAIVGANGAGKTTLVKLLCGLYLPTEGEVRLNGKSVLEYNRDEYYSQFSAVFQDIHLLAAPLCENVSQLPPEKTDLSKVQKCLELSDFKDKVDSLSEKEQTLLVRAVHRDATDLSGGEKQKLAIARALYKDAPVIILDEPTAALDPIAENEVYLKYAELTKGKTSVYISHRLASTRFCDRILLLDGNIISEQGTHDELIKLGGVYANMFNVQASYYRESENSGAGLAGAAVGEGI